MANRKEKSGSSDRFYFLGLQNHSAGDCSQQIKRCLLLGRKAMTNLDSILKSRDFTLPTKVCLVKAMVFPWSCMDVRVGLWRKLSTKELMLFKTVVLGKALGSSLGCREIKPLNPKGNQSWTFIGKTDTEAEAPILWPPYAKNWLIGKNPDSGKGWRQEEKGMTEDEMVGWHHWLDGHEFE